MPKAIKSQDGITYNVLETPSSVTLDSVNTATCQDLGDGLAIANLYVRAEQLRTSCLPLDANPREPTNGRVVEAMRDTLQKSPAKFHHWNNGITVICEDVQVAQNGKSVTLTFSPGMGICNGGHSYFALVTHPTALPLECLVHLEILRLPSGLKSAEKKQQISDIADARNKNRQLQQTTQADFLGLYEPFKAALGAHKQSVRWHEGDSAALEDAIPAELFIRLLAALDPLVFQHPVHSAHKPVHMGAVIGGKRLHSEWMDACDDNDPEGNLRHMAWLSKELMVLCDTIRHTLLNARFQSITGFRKTTFWKDWLNGGKAPLRFLRKGDEGIILPSTALVMLVGCFRHHIWISKDHAGDPNYVGLFEPLTTTWQSAHEDLLDKLVAVYDDSGSDPKQFVRSKAPYNLQAWSLLFGKQQFPLPAEIVRTSDGIRFKRTDKFVNGCFELKYHDGHGELQLAPTTGHDINKLFVTV